MFAKFDYCFNYNKTIIFLTFLLEINLTIFFQIYMKMHFNKNQFYFYLILLIILTTIFKFKNLNLKFNILFIALF